MLVQTFSGSKESMCERAISIHSSLQAFVYINSTDASKRGRSLYDGNSATAILATGLPSSTTETESPSL